MNLAPMSFKDYVWPVNPETVRTERGRNTVEFRTSQGNGALQAGGFAPRRVSGSGRFCGAGCTEEFARLSAVFAEGGSGLLRLPGEAPFCAVFVSLVMKGSPRPNCAAYEFLFLEDTFSSAGTVSEPQIYICTGGENLWEIANRYGTDADTLRGLNPQIEWPDCLAAGERVAVP